MSSEEYNKRAFEIRLTDSYLNTFRKYCKVLMI